MRTTVQALAAVLGGAQSLHTNSRDEALALPTAEAARLALRTQQILAYESGVTETPDPLAGSYYVETLTNELERAALDELAEIERARRHDRRDRPRLPAAPDPGVGLPGPASDRVRRPGRRRGQPVPGRERSRTPALQRIDPEGERRQVEGLRRVRAEREPAAWAAALDRLAAVAGGDENVMPALIDAVRAYATVGEISDRLRAAWGEHRELITV